MIDDPTLLALERRLREGRARMPSQTSESAYAQQARSLSGTKRSTLLGGERPLDRLRQGDLEAVELTAASFREQGAR
jgi:hypothetical protein